MSLAVELDKIGVIRDGCPILQEISLEVEQGQKVAILGPNGAGKSFLLRILCADMIPSSGVVRIFGKQFGTVSLWDLRKRIGFVSSRLQHSFPKGMTVADVVGSGFAGTYALAQSLTKAEAEKVERGLEKLSLAHLMARDFASLSEGEARKTMLVRSLVHDPGLLVLDEPCSGLDFPSTDNFLEALSQESAAKTTVYVTHHLFELPRETERVVLLKNGGTFADGRVEDLLVSSTISELYNCPLEVRKRGGSRYYLERM